MERAGFPSRVPLREDALQTARLKLHPPCGVRAVRPPCGLAERHENLPLAARQGRVLFPPFGAADLAGSLRAVRELTALLFSDFTYQYNILFYIVK